MKLKASSVNLLSVFLLMTSIQPNTILAETSSSSDEIRLSSSIKENLNSTNPSNSSPVSITQNTNSNNGTTDNESSQIPVGSATETATLSDTKEIKNEQGAESTVKFEKEETNENSTEAEDKVLSESQANLDTEGISLTNTEQNSNVVSNQDTTTENPNSREYYEYNYINSPKEYPKLNLIDPSTGKLTDGTTISTADKVIVGSRGITSTGWFIERPDLNVPYRIKELATYKGKKVDILFTAKTNLYTSYIINGSYVSFWSMGGASFESPEMFSITAVEENTNKVIEAPILFGASIGFQDALPVIESDIISTYLNKNLVGNNFFWSPTGNKAYTAYSLSKSDRENYILVAKNGVTFGFINYNSVAGSNQIFTSNSLSSIFYEYSHPEVIGGIEDTQNIAHYTVNQPLAKQFNNAYYPDDFTLTLDVDKGLILNENTLKKIKVYSSKGTNITSYFTPSIGEKHIIQLKINKSNLQKISDGTSISIKLDLDVDMENPNLMDYYHKEDGYLHYPLTAQNNYNNGTSTDNARVKVKAIPSAEGIPQTVHLGSSTADLVASEVIENIKSTLQDDNVKVLGFKEEKTFDRVGETEIYVTIQSEFSGIQVDIKVPVTVINGDLSLVEVPSVLDFGSLKIKPSKLSKDLENKEGNLIIRDTRYKKNSWSLTASMSKPLYNSQANSTLNDVIFYTNNKGMTNVLSSENIEVESHQNKDEKDFVISDTWNKEGNIGFKINVNPGQAKKGNYSGEITWELRDVPGNN